MKTSSRTALRVPLYGAVLLFLAAVVIPNYMKARTTAGSPACFATQIQIDGAKQRWALDHKKTALDTPTPTDLTPYLRQNLFPVCESGGTYRIGAVGEQTTCTAHARNR